MPAPPGTHIKLSEGELSNVQVGRMRKPRSLDTGCRVLATTRIFELGNLLGAESEGGVARRLKTSNGPVKSSLCDSREDDEAEVEIGHHTKAHQLIVRGPDAAEINTPRKRPQPC